MNRDIPLCLNRDNLVYDSCRWCMGYKQLCPNYIASLPTRNSNSVGKKVSRLPISQDSFCQPTERGTPYVQPEIVGRMEKPFYFGHFRILESVLPRPNFLEKFRRSDGR